MTTPADERVVAGDADNARLSEMHPHSGEAETVAAGNSYEDSLQKSFEIWKGINLPNLQRDLDKQGLEIVVNQKESLQSRKKLAEQTRDFKKLSEEERSKELKSLLKAYQAEIDNLTRKAKMAEGAFLNVYKLLAEASDPAPLFQAVMDHHAQVSEMGSLQLNNARLKEELEASAKQVAILRGCDAEAKRLEQRLAKMEFKMESVVKEKVASLETQLKSEIGEKLQHNKERERGLQEQLVKAQEQLARLRTAHESTQAKLIQNSQRYDEEVAARLAELEIVNFELDRAHRSIVDLENRNNLLQEEVDNLRNNNENESKLAEIERERKEREAELEHLVKEANERAAALQDKEEGYLSRQHELEQEILQKNNTVSLLNRRLVAVADYDDIKKELDILKSVEFSLSEDGSDKTGKVGEEDSAKTKDTLEHLLLVTNKKRQNELTALKTAHEALESRISHLTTELVHQSAAVEHYKALSARLEEDLLRMKPLSSPVCEHADSQQIGRPAILPVSTMASSQRGMHSSGGEMASAPASMTTGVIGDPGILSIITAQRNRFRQRNAELEEELRKQTNTLSEIQAKVATLEGDNVKLYEKLKYIQSYRSSGAVPSTVISMDQTSLTSRQMHSSHQKFEDPVTEKYRNMYEERLDPFQAFHRKEETRRYNSLNPADKATLSITRLLIGNRHFRTFLVVYSLMLHLLVLSTTYQLATTEECKHDHNEQMCREFAAEAAAGGPDPAS